MLVSAANQWLRDNSSFAVWKCETVERKVEKTQMGPQILMEKMTFIDSAFGFNVYCRGLRLDATINI